MEIDAYTLAIIGGGFTVIGGVIGALSAYWLATRLEKLKNIGQLVHNCEPPSLPLWL